jgi:hypothetical protein
VSINRMAQHLAHADSIEICGRRTRDPAGAATQFTQARRGDFTDTLHLHVGRDPGRTIVIKNLTVDGPQAESIT